MLEVKMIAGKPVTRTVAAMPTPAGHYDLIVVGLGSAGAEALIVAAEAGLKVLGVDVRAAMGGNWTLGAINGAPKWPGNVPGRLASLERAAHKHGAELAYETSVAAAYRDGQRIVGLKILRNGIFRDVTANMFIDATGNATLALLAGANVRFGRVVDGAQFTVSRTYYVEHADGRMGPVYSGKCRSPNVPVAEQSAFATELAAGRLGFRNKRRVLMACPYIGAREEAGVETDVVLSFRECLFGPRCEKPVFTAWVPYDIHRISDRAFETEPSVNWEILCRMSPFAYPVSVPYEALIAKGVENLLVPSRHMGIDRDVLAGLRMVAEMQMSGKAAAAAVVVALKSGISVREVPYDELRKHLDRYNLARPLRQPHVGFYSKNEIAPFTDDQIIQALKRDIGNAVSWVFHRTPDDEDRSSYAYYSCWDVAERGSQERNSALRNKLVQAMRAEKRYSANYATALGIMGDPQAVEILLEIVRNPGGERDPLVDYAYPNRLKAICLLGRIGPAEAVQPLMDIVADGGEKYTATLLKAKACDYSKYPGWVYPFDGRAAGYRFAAVSLAVVALDLLLKRYPDPGTAVRIREWAHDGKTAFPDEAQIKAIAQRLFERT